MSGYMPDRLYNAVLRIRPQGGDVRAARRPASETGIYLHRHEHHWMEGGTHVWPSGDEDPLWKCVRCGDVICGPAACDPRSTEQRQSHNEQER